MSIKNNSWLSGFLMSIASYGYRIPYVYQKIFNHGRTFTLKGHTYKYFVHPYNATWRNERAIEIPIAWKLINQYLPEDVLEVGNVISHYYKSKHFVVDKFEKGQNVIQEDIVQFKSPKIYNLIICISTLEHIGWDERPKEFGKHKKVLQHLRTMMNSGGTMFVTMPIGYNPGLDEDIGNGVLGFDECLLLKRIALDKWVEASWQAVKNVHYNSPFPRANAIALCWNK